MLQSKDYCCDVMRLVVSSCAHMPMQINYGSRTTLCTTCSLQILELHFVHISAGTSGLCRWLTPLSYHPWPASTNCSMRLQCMQLLNSALHTLACSTACKKRKLVRLEEA